MVRFYALLRLKLRTNYLYFEAADVQEALAYLEKKFGPRFRQQFHVDGKIQDHCLLLLNGVNLRNLKRTELREGDVINILLPYAGG